MSETQKDRDLRRMIRGQLQQCAGWDSDEIAADRERAMAYYHQRPRGDEQPGRSNYIDGSISSMVEATLAQQLEAFTSDNIAEFPPLGPTDEEQAALETAVVTQLIMRENAGYSEIGAAVKNGLMLRNAIMKVHVDEQQLSEVIEVEAFEPELAAAIEQQPNFEVDILEWDEAAKTAKLRVTQTTREFRCEATANENFLYTKDWTSLDLQRIPFCAERIIEPRGEMLRRGFPRNKVMQLKAYHSDYKTDSVARNVRGYTPERSRVDKLAQEIEWFECYVLMAKGDRLERRRVSVAGQGQGSILENIPFGYVPFAAGSPIINPHRFTGISLFDKLRQTQDVNTGLTRALLDNVNSAIRNGRAYLDGAVNEQDLADGRPNKDIRVRRSVARVQDAIMSFDQPDLSSGILSNLEYQRQVRTEMGGASLDLASGEMQMAGGRIGSEGVDRAFSVMEQLSAHMTKNTAASLISNLWLLAHHVIRIHFDQPFDIYRDGTWQQANPSEWPVRKTVVTKVGMSPGERARKVAALGKVLDTQLALAERNMDGVLVDIKGFHTTLMDWCRANDLEVPEQYYIDPASPDAQQAMAEKTEQAQLDQARSMNLMRQAVGLEQIDKALDKYRTDIEYTFKTWEKTLSVQVEEAKMVAQALMNMLGQAPGPALNGNASDDAS